MDKYKNRYRIAPARAQWWDYGWDAAYFITICVRNRKCLFGEVRDKEMILSDLGKIADTSWNDIPNHAKNITLGPSVTMPNHVHGICILTGNQVPFKFVETRHALSLQIDTGDPPVTVGQMRFHNPGKNNASTIIGGYKSAVSKEAHRAGFDFQWQSRFHDHIIRDSDEYERIVRYILNNPANWKDDKFYPT